MADLSSVIELIFRGVDNVSDVTEKVGKNLGDLNDAAGDIAAPFADIADQLLAAESAALAVGAALVGVAVNVASEFDTGFREITTLINQPIEALQGFRTEVLAYAATSTQSLEQVTAATYNAISQGVDYTQSLQAVSTAEKLAVAGKADLNITLQALLGTLNAYGKGMDNAAEFSDVFFTTVKLGKTTIPELAASISGVTSTATLGGISIQELGAAIATVTAAGAGTSEAVTRINAALTAIINPSSQAKDLASELGIAFDVNTLKSKGLAGVLAEVAAKTGGSAEKMAVLFGSTEALNAVNVLAITSSEKFKTNIEAMGKATGATNDAFKKMKDATDTLAQALKVAFVSFGTPLLDSFNGAEDALSSLAQAFIKISTSGEQGFKPLQEFINDSLENITGIIEKVAENLPAAFEGLDWTGLIDSLGGLGKEVETLLQSFFGAIDITTVEGLTSALQTVMNTFEALTRIVTGIISEFRPFADMVGEMIRHFNDLDAASKLEFGQTLGGMKLVTDAGAGLGLALIAIGRAGLDMQTVLDAVFGGVKVAANSVQVTFDLVALGITKLTQVALEASLALYKMNPFADNAVIADSEAKIRSVEEAAAAIAANMERNAQELRDGWNQAVGDAGDKSTELRNKLDAAEVGLKNIGKSTTVATGELMDWSDGLRQANQQAKENKDVVKASESALMDWSDGVKNAKALTIAWGDSLKLPPIELPDGVQKVEDVFKRGGTAAHEYATSIEGVSTAYSQVGGGTVKATGAFAAVADKTQDAKDQLDALTKSGKLTVDQLIEITKNADDFQVKMEEIASNERIKTIELAVGLQTAKLETDMERVKATFASLDTTINSTGDLLNSLFGNYTDTTDRFKQLEIESQIDLENKRRQEALDMQKKLVEAEIARIEAQTNSLNRGDALITIQGDGLEPELEAFMWKILNKIRTRANAEFADYLLGLGVTA